MAIDYKALGAKAAAEGRDMTQATVGGGGDYTPPAAGPCRLRLVGYVELGKQKIKMKGIEQIKDRVLLVFELSGKNHMPADVDGKKVPQRISIEENLSLNEKANFFKLFNRMNYSGQWVHMTQMLGEPFKGEVVHDKWTGTDGKERVTAVLRNAQGYTVAPARVEDDEVEGGWRALEVAPAISDIRCFLWEQADMDQWNGLFIEGEYPERKDKDGKVTAKAKSKNVLQDHVKRAVNFVGSPIHTLLLNNGGNLDIPDAEDPTDDLAAPEGVTPVTPAAPPTKTQMADALTGIV